MIKNAEIPELIRAVVPEMNSLIEEHLKDYSVVAPRNYALIGDLFDYVIQLWKRGERERMCPIFEFIERALAEGTPEVQDMICIEFVQPIGKKKEYTKGLTQMLGPLGRECLLSLRA